MKYIEVWIKIWFIPPHTRARYDLEYYADENDVVRGHAINSYSIMDMTTDTFSVTGPFTHSSEVQNRNDFKKFRGIVGLVSDKIGISIPGVTVIR